MTGGHQEQQFNAPVLESQDTFGDQLQSETAEGTSLEIFLQDTEDAFQFEDDPAADEKEILNLLDST